MLNDKEKSNIKAIEEILFRNKTGNYTIHPMRLIAYIVVRFGKETSVQFTWKEDEWLRDNFTKVQFQRSLGFLKEKDLLQRLVTRKEPAYKVNFQFLSRIVAESLDIDALLEIRRFFIRRKKKLKQKKLKESSANFGLIRNSRPNKTTATTASKLNSEHCNSVESVQDKSVLREKCRRRGADTISLANELKKRGKRKPRVRKDSIKQYEAFKFNPSENPKLNVWRNREVEAWRSIDFLGFYICLYKRETGFENISLQDFQAYTKVKRMVRFMLQHWFNNDRNIMRRYIEWSVSHFTHEMDGRYSPSIETLLNPYRKTRWVYDMFVKNQSKKGKRKKDSDWASDDKWR